MVSKTNPFPQTPSAVHYCNQKRCCSEKSEGESSTTRCCFQSSHSLECWIELQRTFKNWVKNFSYPPALLRSKA